MHSRYHRVHLILSLSKLSFFFLLQLFQRFYMIYLFMSNMTSKFSTFGFKLVCFALFTLLLECSNLLNFFVQSIWWSVYLPFDPFKQYLSTSPIHFARHAYCHFKVFVLSMPLVFCPLLWNLTSTSAWTSGCCEFYFGGSVENTSLRYIC